METSHYITLPCKVTNASDPVNNLSNFTSKLAEEIDLEDDWEVGLAEISFSKNWVNLPVDQQLDIIVFKPDEVNYFKTLTSDELKISKGEKFIWSLKDECNKVKDKVFFEKDGAKYLKMYPNKKVTRIPGITWYENDIYYFPGVFEDNEYFYVRYDNILGNMLGLDKNAITNYAYNQFVQYKNILSTKEQLDKIDYSVFLDNTFRFRCWKTPNRDRNLKYIYVTSDVIKNDRYRNKKKNLLRIIDIPEDKIFGDQITHVYENIYYFPLAKNKFESINIEIFIDDSDSSEHVPFLFGELYLVLHLRKVDKTVKIYGEDPTIESPVPKQPPEEIGSPFDVAKVN